MNESQRTTPDLTRLPREPVDRLTHPFVRFLGFVVVPVFALANAGLPIALSNLEVSVTATIFLALVVGKPVGILAFCWLGVRMGIATRPPELSWGILAGGSVLAGIGFTMALFIADRAFDQARDAP